MKAYWGVEVLLHSFFVFATRWKWVVSFTPWPLYPQGKSPWYPLDKRMGGPQSRGPDAVVKWKIPNHRRDSNPPIIQPVAHRYTAELSRL
jgi:hypothetical protein